MSGEVDKWTVEQCRDWLRDSDWEYTNGGQGVWHWKRKADGVRRSNDHPIPATLDAAAGAMPEGWKVNVEISRNGQCWAEASRKDNYLPVDDHDPYATGDSELEARFRLAVKARMAGAQKGPQ